MDYKYDVFISYKRDWMNEQWLDEIFIPLFLSILKNKLGREPRIFLDRKALNPGVDFNDELFCGLVFSKSMLSLWDGSYFKGSQWCVKEFMTMVYQQQRYGLDAQVPPRSLILPVITQETGPLPVVASSMTYSDYSDYFFVGEAMKSSIYYLELQKKIRADIATLSSIIEHAPELHEDLKTDEGKTSFITQLNAYLAAQHEGAETKQAFLTW